jgi:hypothetical protein
MSQMPGKLTIVEDLVELAAKSPAIREAGETALRAGARLGQEALDLLGETRVGQKAIELGSRLADEANAEGRTFSKAKDGGGMDRGLSLSRFIDVHGKAPENAIESAAQNSRLLAFGEIHPQYLPAGQIDTQRPFGIAIMKQLQQQGFTHLAVEQPVGGRASIDALINDKPVGSPLNVNELAARHSAVSETINTTSIFDPRSQTAGGELMGLMALEGNLKHSPDYVNLLLAARDAGLKVVPIDHNLAFARVMDPMRDTTMAEESMAILDSDKNNKVAAWLGGYHATRSETSFAQLMARNFATRGQNEKVTSFMFANGRVASSSLRPTIVPTMTSDTPNSLGRFIMNGSDIGELDHLIVIP